MTSPVPKDTSGLRLRLAVAHDLEMILAVKSCLRLQRADDSQRPERGGFLLGTSPAQYTRMIRAGGVHVLCDGDEVVGFATTLADAELRASDLWQRRGSIDLGAQQELLAGLEQLPLGYLDQLALRPDPKYMLCGVLLAYHAVAALFHGGAALVITTVVAEPVRNLASRPLLAAVGALRVGSIAEHYESIGAITSDIFVIARAALDPAAHDDPRRGSRLRRLEGLSRSLGGA